jgi:hypothetical protein
MIVLFVLRNIELWGRKKRDDVLGLEQFRRARDPLFTGKGWIDVSKEKVYSRNESHFHYIRNAAHWRVFEIYENARV